MAKHKVLICGDFTSRVIPLSIQCADALEALGHQVVRIDTEDHVSKRQALKRRLLKSLSKVVGMKKRLAERFQEEDRQVRTAEAMACLDKERPDMVLVVRGNDVDPAFLRAARERGAFLACWWIKDLRTVHKIEAERPYFDAYFSIHRNLAQDGIEYLPAYAKDLSRFSPPPTPAAPKRDVVFVGIWTPKRQRFLEAIADFKLTIVGPGWSRKTRDACPRLAEAVIANKLYGDALRDLYREARIVVNINQWENDEATGTTLRVADVPCCGPLLLTEYSAGLGEIFTPEEEIAVFSTPEELRQQIAAYLGDESRRQQVAQAGMDKALALPDHRQRMEALMQAVDGAATVGHAVG